jgi:hypothetical protein
MNEGTGKRKRSLSPDEGPSKRQEIDETLAPSLSSAKPFNPLRHPSTGIGARYGEGSTSFQESPMSLAVQMAREMQGQISRGDRSLKRRKDLIKIQYHLLEKEYDRQAKLINEHVGSLLEDQRNKVRSTFESFYDKLNTHKEEIEEIDAQDESKVSTLENEQKTLRKD